MKHVPLRTCVVCRAQKDKSELLRIVKRDDAVEIDRSGKAAGRGAYVCDCDECKSALLKKRMLNRVYKTQLDQSVYDALAKELGGAQ